LQVFGVPSIVTMSPASIVNGASVRVRLTGRNFSLDSRVVVSGAGLATSNQAIMNDGTVLDITLTANGAASGARSLTVTNSLGASNAVTFAVQ
jgi:hypothetical protein